jgi:hypothetical protein
VAEKNDNIALYCKPGQEDGCLAQLQGDPAFRGFRCGHCAQKFWRRPSNMPEELRAMVYLHAFEALPSHSARPTRKAHSERPPILNPVCYVNKQALADSLPTILACSGKGLVVQSYQGMGVLAQFPNRVPHQRSFRSVQELHVPDLDTRMYPPSDTATAL